MWTTTSKLQCRGSYVIGDSSMDAWRKLDAANHKVSYPTVRRFYKNEVNRTNGTKPYRFPLWHVSEQSLTAWAIPFLGADKSIVERSQYYDYHENGKKPIAINTYFTILSFCNAVLLSCWLCCFSVLALIPPTKRLLLAYPDRCSFNMFKAAGPSKEQIRDASFEYYIYGRGWGRDETIDAERPTKAAAAVCRGPDPGYTGTSACVISAALAIINDRDKLPKQGGVYTTASAFRDTRIYDYLENHGITYEIIDEN